MKRLFASFGWLMLLLPLISVAGARTAYISMNQSANESQTRQVSGFSGIASSGSFDVFVKFAGTETLKLEGNEADLNEVETKVENGILKIGFKPDIKNRSNHAKITVYITAKALNNLTQSGSGHIKVDGTLKAESVQSRISGSGTITFAANTDKLSTAISGSGSVAISGITKTANVIVSGSGKFNGQDLRAADASVKVSGSGNARIYAEQTLDAAVSGSGRILYDGNARITGRASSGSGRISKM